LDKPNFSLAASYDYRYGLIYVIFDKITRTAKKESPPPKDKLIRIEYTIPDVLEKEMFVEEK
jgi:beta-glucosidase/6-phospho-beta-glucosidase/beta-galactosidase